MDLTYVMKPLVQATILMYKQQDFAFEFVLNFHECVIDRISNWFVQIEF